MVNGISQYLNSSYALNSYGSYNALSSLGSSSAFSSSAASSGVQSMLDNFVSGKNEVKKLTAQSSDFLNKYTAGMKTQSDAAYKLMGSNLDKLLYDKEGNVTGDTIKATVDAAQKLVDAHNANVKLLNDNADRGAGVTAQLARMVDDPASKYAMKMLGMNMNKDGTLTLDAAKLTESLSTTNPNQLQLVKNELGSYGGFASNLRNDATKGMNMPAAKLINNDIAKMQTIQKETSLANNFSEYAGYNRVGAYSLNNMAAIGMLMNFAV